MSFSSGGFHRRRRRARVPDPHWSRPISRRSIPWPARGRESTHATVTLRGLVPRSRAWARVAEVVGCSVGEREDVESGAQDQGRRDREPPEARCRALGRRDRTDCRPDELGGALTNWVAPRPDELGGTSSVGLWHFVGLLRLLHFAGLFSSHCASESPRFPSDASVARPLRFLPPGTLVEVTVRTVHGRLLLRPSAAANDRILGVIGRAQKRYGMTIHGFVVLSNHAHLLLSPDSPQQLAAFMDYVLGNVAREIGRLHDWREKFWARRYRSILVSHEEEAQVARLLYLLGQGVKEGLVAKPQDWPGVHCAEALLAGVDLGGTWFDRTAQYLAWRRGDDRSDAHFAESERVVFSPLPCWGALHPAAYRRRIAGLIERVVDDGRRERDGKPVLGKRAIRAQHPHDKPVHCDRSPAPPAHAATPEVRLMLRIAYWQFVAAFREAARRLRLGDRLVRFPPGAFPPPLPCLVPTG
jgi:REP element-mobilizing transposase RayT